MNRRSKYNNSIKLLKTIQILIQMSNIKDSKRKKAQSPIR